MVSKKYVSNDAPCIHGEAESSEGLRVVAQLLQV